MDLHLGARRILVVGASAGIGSATARALASEGARLALVARRRERLELLATELGALAIARDVSQPGQADLMVEEAVQELGGLDGLAVVAGAMGQRGPFLEADDRAWTNTLDRILLPVVRSCRAALPHLIEAHDGAIVTVAAYSMRAPHPHMTDYAAMKSAVATLTKSLAKAYGGQGVRANCVAPGVMVSARADELVETYGAPAERAQYLHVATNYGMKVALERAGRAEEVADLIAFLLSNRTAYVTGALINIDGGTDF